MNYIKKNEDFFITVTSIIYYTVFSNKAKISINVQWIQYLQLNVIFTFNESK